VSLNREHYIAGLTMSLQLEVVVAVVNLVEKYFLVLAPRRQPGSDKKRESEALGIEARS